MKIAACHLSVFRGRGTSPYACGNETGELNRGVRPRPVSSAETEPLVAEVDAPAEMDPGASSRTA